MGLQLEVKTEVAKSVAISPDGNMIASGDGDG